MLLSRRKDVKLADFGLAVVVESSAASAAQSKKGTTIYFSPEKARCTGWIEAGKADLWAVGCVLAELVEGELLVGSLWDDGPVVNALREAKVAQAARAAPVLGQVARGLLELNPERRLSAKDMLFVVEGRGAAPHAAPAQVQGVHQAPATVPGQAQMEGQLLRRNPAAGFFVDKFKTVCSCRQQDGVIHARATRDGVPEDAETLYNLADWRLLRLEKLDQFSLSLNILQTRQDKAGVVTFKAASVAEAQMWIGAIEKTPQERGRREAEERAKKEAEERSAQVCTYCLLSASGPSRLMNLCVCVCVCVCVCASLSLLEWLRQRQMCLLFGVSMSLSW